MNRYVLDANVFIEAHQRYYPFDVCPGYWKALLDQHEKRRVFSIDRVKDELEEGGDQLENWAKTIAPESFFKKTADMDVVRWYRKMVEWVNNQPQFTDGAKADFAKVADGWLVAYAKRNNLVVVTQEEFSPHAKARVLIPNLCREFKVEYVNTFDMLRELEIRLVLGRPR